MFIKCIAMDANDDGDISKRTQTNLSRPRKCLYVMITTATFNIVILSGLSLLASGSYIEQVSHDEGEQTNERKLHFSLHPLAIFGLAMTGYAILGQCLNCTNRLPGKYQIYWLLNLVCILMVFVITYNRHMPPTAETVDLSGQ